MRIEIGYGALQLNYVNELIFLDDALGYECSGAGRSGMSGCKEVLRIILNILYRPIQHNTPIYSLHSSQSS